MSKTRLLPVIYSKITKVTQAQFLLVDLEEIESSKKHPGTWLRPTRLHSREDQSFQLHIDREREKKCSK